MTYQVIRDEEAQAQIRKLSPVPRKGVNAAIRALRDGLDRLDTKQLDGYESRWRARVGRWRVIFDLNEAERVIRVVRVGPRTTVYEGLKPPTRRR